MYILPNLINIYKINQKILTDEELKLFKNGGIQLSDDSDEFQDNIPIKELKQYVKPHQKKINNYQTHQSNTQNQSIISRLEKTNQYLENELQRVKIAQEAEKQKIQTNYRIEQDKLLFEIKKLKSELSLKKNQIPEIRETLALVRDILAGFVPESNYLKIRDLNEKDLTLQEWILIQVYEIVYPYKQESLFQKKEILSLREELQQLNDKLKSNLADYEHNQKILNDREDDLKRHKMNYENQRKAIQFELQKKDEELDILREKGARFDELNRDYKRLEQEKLLLEEKIGFGGGAQQKISKENKLASDMLKRQDEFQRKQEMLAQDKEYLSKENSQLIEKNRRLEDKIESLEKQFIEAKNQGQDYLHQLLNTRNDTTSQYEKKIYNEIQSLKEKQQHELELTKNNLVDLYEKQLQFLKEAKEEIQIKKESLEGQLREKTYAYDQVMLDYRTLQRRLESDMSEQRVQLRIKQEQLERVENIYEENLSNLKTVKQENEMLKEKINILKSEYYKIQVDCKEDMAGLKGQLEVAKQQLQNYEGIEKEIDEAIMQTDDIKQNQVLGIIGTIPTSNKRRIQQAMNLAQRLQQKQKECEVLIKENKEREGQIQRLKEENEIQQDVIDKMHQPHSYLVHHIEERDREILKYKQSLRKNEQEYQILRMELDDIKNRYRQAEQDIDRLKIKRQNIKNIQEILIGMAQTQNHQDMKHNLKCAINNISDALGNKSNTDYQKYGEQTPPSHDQQVPNWYQKLKNKKK